MANVVMITGAANGIGRRLAALFAADGDAIAAIDRDAPGLESLSADLRARGQSIATAVADVTCVDELRAAVASLEHSLQTWTGTFRTLTHLTSNAWVS